MECLVVQSSEIEGRLDPHFYRPYFMNEFNALSESKFEIVELSKLCTRVTDGTHYTPTYVGSGVPFISVKDVRENSISFADIKFISNKEHNRLAKRCRPEEDDILLTKIGTVGLSAVVPSHVPEFSIFVSVALLKIDKAKASPHYVSAFLNSRFTKFQIDRVLKGIGVPDLHLENISKIRIPIPPLETQNQIVQTMESAYQAKSQKEREADKILDSIDDYVLDELEIELPEFEDQQCFTIPSDEVKGNRIDPHYYHPKFIQLTAKLEGAIYSFVALKDLIIDISGGATPRVDGDYYSDRTAGVPFLRVQNISDKGIILDDLKYIKKEVHESALKRSQLRENDLVFTITGRIGSVSVIPKGFEGNINQHSVRFHLKDKIEGNYINPNFVSAYLNSFIGKMLSIRGATGGTRPALDYAYVKQLKIPVLPLDTQNKIANEIQIRTIKARRLNEEAKEALENAKAKVERIILDKP